MPHSYSRAEQALLRDLRKRMKSEPDELIRVQLLESIEKIRKTAEKRGKTKTESADESSIAEVAYTPPPVRDEFEDENSWAERQELFRLDLKEGAAYEVVNSPKSTLRAIQDAERELKKIESRRRELHPDGYAMEPNSASASVQAISPKELLDVSKMNDIVLRERFSREKFFRDYLGMDYNGDFIAALETEIRKRKLLLIWNVESTDLYVDGKGEAVSLMTDTVFMGTVPNPNPRPTTTEERVAFTPTSLQKAYWERGRRKDVVVSTEPSAETIHNRTRVYRLFDGTMFFSDGEVLTSIPMGVTVFSASDPPGYKQNSHAIPPECAFDEGLFAWRRR